MQLCLDEHAASLYSGSGSDRISARLVSKWPVMSPTAEGERRNELMGLSVIGIFCLEGGALG
jgi:hypothetical protein